MKKINIFLIQHSPLLLSAVKGKLVSDGLRYARAFKKMEDYPSIGTLAFTVTEELIEALHKEREQLEDYRGEDEVVIAARQFIREKMKTFNEDKMSVQLIQKLNDHYKSWWRNIFRRPR